MEVRLHFLDEEENCNIEGALTLDEFIEKVGLDNAFNAIFNKKEFWERYYKRNPKELKRINKIMKKKEKEDKKTKKLVSKIIKKHKRKCVEII